MMLSEGIRSIGDGLLEIAKEHFENLVVDQDINAIYDVEQTPFARGKFATVRRAVHKKTGVQFAAKFLRRRRRAQCTIKEISHEIAILMLCADSKHIVKLHSVHDTKSETALLLELATGGELQAILDDEGALSESHAKICMREVLYALQYLHKKYIAHLDLKPQNILLCGEKIEDGLKLCDFGISRIVEEGGKVREILGTPDYVAPEVLQYEPLSLKTDIWSVGVLAYVLLTGCSPFGGDTKQETFLNISQCSLTFPEELFEDVSPLAIDFIRSTLRIKPNDRMSASECLEHRWLLEDTQLLQKMKSPINQFSTECIDEDNQNTNNNETTLNNNSNNSSNSNSDTEESDYNGGECGGGGGGGGDGGGVDEGRSAGDIGETNDASCTGIVINGVGDYVSNCSNNNNNTFNNCNSNNNKNNISNNLVNAQIIINGIDNNNYHNEYNKENILGHLNHNSYINQYKNNYNTQSIVINNSNIDNELDYKILPSTIATTTTTTTIITINPRYDNDVHEYQTSSITVPLPSTSTSTSTSSSSISTSTSSSSTSSITIPPSPIEISTITMSITPTTQTSSIMLFPDAPTTPKVCRKSVSDSPPNVKALVKKFQLESQQQQQPQSTKQYDYQQQNDCTIVVSSQIKSTVNGHTNGTVTTIHNNRSTNSTLNLLNDDDIEIDLSNGMICSNNSNSDNNDNSSEIDEHDFCSVNGPTIAKPNTSNNSNNRCTINCLMCGSTTTSGCRHLNNGGRKTTIVTIDQGIIC